MLSRSSCGLYSFSSRHIAPIYAASHHISVLMIMCCFNTSPLQPFHCQIVLLLRDCVDHLTTALGYRRRGEASSSPPETACQFSASFSTPTKKSGRSKGPNVLSIRRPRPTQTGSGFGLFYPSSYGVASPRALYRIETGGPVGDVEFEI
mmetsp:Transcript_36925/g.84317  ORF Transcript_36925/g.84317 Transcript_36925/m.84317 type:complete len:149 (+) Transcript_36925:93-539(+)